MTYTVPPHCTIYLNTGCTHANPEIWGSDAPSFRPSRWIGADGNIIRPAPGTFAPWSLGPRICPGQKMAQVEFVAVMLAMFSAYKLSPVLQPEEKFSMAQKRLQEIMTDSQPRITLEMNRPKDVILRWEKR